MQARRRAQPRGTNRPSSSQDFTPAASDRGRSRDSLCGPQGHAGAPGRSAAHRSAVLAAGARPVPFRTRKLSRPAPMVLRGKPVGEQGAADRWTALRRRGGPRGMFPRGPPLFCVWGYWSPLGSLGLVGPLRVRAELPAALGDRLAGGDGVAPVFLRSSLACLLAGLCPMFPEPLSGAL